LLRHAALAVLTAALSVAAAQAATPGAAPARAFVVDPADGKCLNCGEGDPSAEVAAAVRACGKVALEDWFAERFVKDPLTRRPLGEKGQAGRSIFVGIQFGICVTQNDDGLVCYEKRHNNWNDGYKAFFVRYDKNGRTLWRRRAKTFMNGLVYPFVTDSEIIYEGQSKIVFLSLRTGKPVRELPVTSELCPVDEPRFILGDDPKGCVAGVVGRYLVLQVERWVMSDVKARKGGWVRQNACVVPIRPAAEK